MQWYKEESDQIKRHLVSKRQESIGDVAPTPLQDTSACDPYSRCNQIQCHVCELISGCKENTF